MTTLPRIRAALAWRLDDLSRACRPLTQPGRLLRSGLYRLNLYRLSRSGPRRLNLGGGDTRIDGFCGIDADLCSRSDLIGGVETLRLRSRSVEAIYSSHVLEHIPRARCRGVLKEWFRVLTEGGQLFVAVPDLEALCAIYLSSLHGRDAETLDLAAGMIYGGQGNPYNFHSNGFSLVTMKAMLESVGFDEVRRFDAGSLGFVTPPGDGANSSIGGVPTSLNVAARKPLGPAADEREGKGV